MSCEPFFRHLPSDTQLTLLPVTLGLEGHFGKTGWVGFASSAYKSHLNDVVLLADYRCMSILNLGISQSQLH